MLLIAPHVAQMKLILLHSVLKEQRATVLLSSGDDASALLFECRVADRLPHVVLEELSSHLLPALAAARLG